MESKGKTKGKHEEKKKIFPLLIWNICSMDLQLKQCNVAITLIGEGP
jgi:hypothetical protein